MDDVDSMGPSLQPVIARFSNFFLGKVSLQFKLHGMSIFHDIQMATYFDTAWSYSHMVGYAGSPTCTVYVGMTLTPSKVKVSLSGLLNFRQLAKPCMLAAMTAAPLRGFLVLKTYDQQFTLTTKKSLHIIFKSQKLHVSVDVWLSQYSAYVILCFVQ